MYNIAGLPVGYSSSSQVTRQIADYKPDLCIGAGQLRSWMKHLPDCKPMITIVVATRLLAATRGLMGGSPEHSRIQTESNLA